MLDQTLAHYKILDKIGSGGMGDVYLAEDTKLDRKVALKVLPPDLAENEERRARFQREAKAIAALDHPNIVQVFSVEEAEGTHFITMQLVQGKTLTELLPKNGFSLNKFFDIAIPLADAVAAAHQEGITHRDLKPDNVMVSDERRVKVLDFGLAKPTAAITGMDSELPTQAKTAAGVIVGTLHYMSPEQAQGKSVDARSDIFSLGVVFYEMLTGARPFAGETTAEILSSIIKDTQGAVSDINPRVPRDLARLVKRCLTKDPIRRYQSAIDLRNDLEETKQDVDSGVSVAAAAPGVSPKRGWYVGAAAALLLVALWMWSRAEDVRPAVPQLANPVQLTSAVGVEDFPTWSPDGRTLAYEASGDIWVTTVDQGQPVNRTADHSGGDAVPSWSPDGNQIAFWSDRDGGGYLVMSALGGPARKVISSSRADGPPQWSRDGEELATLTSRYEDPERNVHIVSLRTRESRRVTVPGDTVGRYDPSWSPDERFMAYVDAVSRVSDLTQLVSFRQGCVI